jgi:hypothetical protein
MRRGLAAAVTLAILGGCNLYGGTTSAPTGFSGWFHVDRAGRATSISFGDSNLASVRDLGCDRVLNGETQWTSDGDAVVLPQWTTPAPRFTQASGADAGLVANPGMYGTAQEVWLPGATCLVCPQDDAGVAVACDAPAVLDGGT